ncbi:MAG TPA: hypothetical protein VJ343_01645 [archaeon]|nr:hypothetical protein [archaeon]
MNERNRLTTMKELVYDCMKDSEKQVASYLDELSLRWVYEFPVFIYDEKERPRVWSPDFYIPKLGMYIEVCGSEGFDYDYRERMYRKNGYYIVFVQIYKETKWRSYLVKRIMEIEDLRHSEVSKMIQSLKFS